MSSKMSIRVSTAQGRVPVTIFHVNGEIDVSNYEELQAYADQAFESGARYLLLDLSETSYIASAGLRALHYIYKLFRTDASGESNQTVSQGLKDGSYKALHLKLLNPKPGVHQALKISGLDMYLGIFFNEKEAVEAF